MYGKHAIRSVLAALSAWFLVPASFAAERPAGVELTTAERATLVSSVQSPAGARRDETAKLQQTVSIGVVHLGPAGEATVQLGSAPPQSHPAQAGQADRRNRHAGRREGNAGRGRGEGRGQDARPPRADAAAGPQVGRLPAAAFARRHRLHARADRGREDAVEVHRAGHRRRRASTADYPAGRAVQVERRGALGGRQLPASRPRRRSSRSSSTPSQTGQIGLDALYGNELTGALPAGGTAAPDAAAPSSCRQRCGVKIDSAMISDVPGYTWGIVPAFGQAGVKYFSIGPNDGDRIGYTLERLGRQAVLLDRPDGRDKVLCWIPDKGYWQAFQAPAEQSARPPARSWRDRAIPTTWCRSATACGDNAGPDAEPLPSIVKDWNAKYAYPEAGHRHHQRDVPRVREALRRQAARGPRRFHALLGRRGGVVGPRDGPEPHRRRAARRRPRRSGPCSPRRRTRPTSSTRPGAT